MKYLMWVDGKIRKCKVINRSLQEMVQTTQLEETIETRQPQWLGHFIGITEAKNTRKCGVRKRRGRPRVKLENSIREATEKGEK